MKPEHSPEAFKRLAQAIVDRNKQLNDLIPEAQALRDFLESITQFRIEGDIGAGETRLDKGLAVSPTIAAMCLRELARTPAFIRGTHQAITESLRPDRPVQVLYAGCGPYALLALAPMALLSQEQVRFTLLDIHQESLDRARALIDGLGLSSHVEEYVLADATRYRIPSNRMPDVIVSETMAVCLHNEPQVSIARHLLGQAPGAKMVPQSVAVEAWLINQAKEHVFLPADHSGPIPAPQRDRVRLGRIFELNAANIQSWAGMEGDRLPAGAIELPDPIEPRYQPFLLTLIQVYGENCLKDYQSSLTLPRPIRESVKAGDTLQFHYLLAEHPQLEFTVSGEGVVR